MGRRTTRRRALELMTETRMFEPTPTRSAAVPEGWPQEPPYDPDAPPVQRATLPPGMVWGMTAAGELVPTYVQQPAAAEQPHAQPAKPDRWPARLLAGGASTSAVLWVVGEHGEGLERAGHAVQQAGVGVALVVAGVGGLIWLVKGAAGRAGGQQVNVNVSVSATGGDATASSSAEHSR